MPATRASKSVSAGNRVGVVLARGSKCTVVNSTVADNASLAISLTANRESAPLNNLLSTVKPASTSRAITRTLRLITTCTSPQFTGKIAGEPTRRSVESWRDGRGRIVTRFR